MLRDAYHRVRQATTGRNPVRATGRWVRTQCRHDRRTWEGYERTVELRGPRVPASAMWMVVQRGPGGREQVIEHSLTRPAAVETAERYMSALAEREGARQAATHDQIAVGE